MASEQFSLCWDNFHKNMSSGMQSLLETEDLVDVTLAVEGRYLKAHKMVLSVCSPYFRELFQGNPCKHPIVFMRDVSYVALSDLLHFMYQGEVQVAQENLSTFIKTAEALQIKGLTGDGGVQNESESDQEVEKTATETTTKRTLDVSDSKSSATSRPKKFSGPASKRPKISNTPSVTSSPATSTPVATTGNKYEVASVNTNNVESNNDVDLKMEPNGSGDQTNTEIDDDSQLDQYTDDGTAFEMTDETEDFSLMESGNDEPKPGTSADAGENQEMPSSLTLLSEQSRKKYEAAYELFTEWRKENNFDSVCENVLLKYFEELSKKYKPSSQWIHYSMLRSTIHINYSINIEHFKKLREFLKLQSQDYKAKTTKVFTPEDINKFIYEAPDHIYLATKVAFIMGVMGDCRRYELQSMSIDHLQDLGTDMIVSVPTVKKNSVRKFIISGHFYNLCKKYIDLRPAHATSRSLFLNFQKGKCTPQHIGKNKFGAMGKQVATFLKLPDPDKYTGRSFRKASTTVLVDASGGIIISKENQHTDYKATLVTKECVVKEETYENYSV